MTGVETFWARTLELTKNRVDEINQSGQQLAFSASAVAFQITRKSPYLSVQRWLGEGSISGCSVSTDKKDGPVHGISPPVLVRSDSSGEMVLESEGSPVTLNEIVDGALRAFACTEG